jgi:formate hydrogenlyase subunit 3/multisubunit Na+/H+ antiporter MnhD subunit
MTEFTTRTPEGVFNYLLVGFLLMAAVFGVIFWLAGTGVLQP